MHARLPSAASLAAASAVALVVLFHRKLRRSIAQWILEGQMELAGSFMPDRIVLVRHGEAEHNIDDGSILQLENPGRKPDNLSELTATGREQAYAAGRHVRELVGDQATISVIVSPFERTQQTLYCVQQVLGPLRHLVSPAPVAAAENGAGAEGEGV